MVVELQGCLAVAHVPWMLLVLRVWLELLLVTEAVGVSDALLGQLAWRLTAWCGGWAGGVHVAVWVWGGRAAAGTCCDGAARV